MNVNTMITGTWSGLSLPMVRRRSMWTAEFRDDEAREVVFVVERHNDDSGRWFTARILTDGCEEPVCEYFDTAQEAADAVAIEYVNALDCLGLSRCDAFAAYEFNRTMGSLFA